MQPGMAIRNEDPRPLLQRLVAVYRSAYRGLEAYAYRTDREVVAYLQWLYKRDPEGFLVAYRDGEVVGFIATDARWVDYRGERIGEIHELAVDAAYQGRGIGKALCLAGLEHLRDRGHRRFGLWVGEHNTRAQALYEKLGFRKVGQWGIWVRMIRDDLQAGSPG
jgi:ribosomal protein S18 acetylase RimI-like enzyme